MSLALGACVMTAAPAAAAQGAADTLACHGSIFQRLGLDRLQLTAVGVAAGPVRPAKTRSTQAYSVHADYGEIARHLRVVFVVSYWGSEFRPEIVDRFTQQLRATVIDPSGDDTLRIGRVTVSDVSLETDLRWSPRPRAVLRPYLGGGAGLHVINAENRAIAGTFVESALDNIAVGTTGVAGVDLALLPSLSVGVQGRYTLLSTVRFASVRATGTYSFHLRRIPRST